MRMNTYFLNGGYCRQFQGAVDGHSLKLVRFHAVFFAIQHPTMGWIICDTGYGGRFYQASRRWPYRLFRYITPVKEQGTAAAALARVGIDPESVRHVIITHFHADHIGGLADFPKARVYYHEDALSPLAALSPLKQTLQAFLPQLVPADLSVRSQTIPQNQFQEDNELSLPVFDLFDDRTLRLVYLPGHAPGQLGIWFEHENGSLLYATDAYWRTMQIDQAVDLPRPVLKMQWDPTAYRATLEKLRRLRAAGNIKLLACHDTETQNYISA